MVRYREFIGWWSKKFSELAASEDLSLKVENPFAVGKKLFDPIFDYACGFRDEAKGVSYAPLITFLNIFFCHCPEPEELPVIAEDDKFAS